MRIGSVSSRIGSVVAVVSLLLISGGHLGACSWAIGYFYQVTALRGRVVGTETSHVFAPRWLRQSFARKYVKLALYEYRQPFDSKLIVKTVETDKNGVFDFGPLKIGYYTLTIDDQDAFDVEVKNLPQVTESVLIDASPVYPDCSGGHEFIVKTK